MNRPTLKFRSVQSNCRFEPFAANEIINVPEDRHKLKARQVKTANERWKDTKFCMLCGDRFSDSTRPVIDHCHVTGVIRGKICNRCNQGLSMFKERLAILKEAVRYMEYFNYNPDMVEPNLWGDWYGLGDPRNTHD